MTLSAGERFTKSDNEGVFLGAGVVSLRWANNQQWLLSRGRSWSLQSETWLIKSRHGTRLDAADKQWHLTSPTPYDPPLTYGGWRQSHALGGRIANILHQRENEGNFQPPNGVLQHPCLTAMDGKDHDGHGHLAANGRRAGTRKHRIIIHTSPFLRCVQTAIAVSAGIAETKETLATVQSRTGHSVHAMHSGSPHIRAMEHWNSPQLSAISEPEEFDEEQSRDSQDIRCQLQKPLLRIDAFLGSGCRLAISMT